MMKIVRLKIVIDASRQLQLQLPPDIPIGEVEVIIMITPSDTTLGAAPAIAFRELFAVLDADQRTRLSTEELDRWIQGERDAWD
jgi:hypothetical protein